MLYLCSVIRCFVEFRSMEILTHSLNFSEYRSKYLEKERFEKLCRECGNYGHCWTCPPFAAASLPDLDKYDNILLIACRIDVGDNDVMEVIAENRRVIEKELLSLETASSGLAFGFTGFCPYCKECNRPSGEKCRFPQKARPALEAYGFDLCRTMEDFFGESLHWTAGNEKRHSVTLIGGLAYNGSVSPSFKLSND